MGQPPRPVDPNVALGQVVLGKYRVDQIVGHGAMGVVARCMHLALNEQVAIKMLRKDVLLDRDAVERFTREAQAAVKLRSEYVARVLDVGTFDNGVPYMVMEFLDGHDLGELIDERGCLPAPWATELMLQAAEALSEAHSIGIVHRDVKPTNLFVTWRPDGSALIKVLDFGISKSPQGTDLQLTQTQSLLGTPAYMSPEQMRSARMVDARSDIWSLGTVMYELLEGRRPFEADSFSEMCVKVAVDPPAPMINAPPGLQQVVLRCLAKSPEQRYASMAELGRELVPFSQDQHQAAMLVERMQRMLDRASQVDWDAPSALHQPPAAVTAPIGSPPDPDTQAFGTTPARGAPQPYAGREPPKPVHPARPNRHRLAAAAGFGALVVIGIAIGLVVGLRGADDPPATARPIAKPAQPAGDAIVRAPARLAADTAAADTAAADTAAADKAAADTAAADKAAADRAAADKAAADKAAADRAAADRASTVKRRPPIKAVDPPRPPVKPPGVTKPCDVYDQQHDCPDS